MHGSVLHVDVVSRVNRARVTTTMGLAIATLRDSRCRCRPLPLPLLYLALHPALPGSPGTDDCRLADLGPSPWRGRGAPERTQGGPPEERRDALRAAPCAGQQKARAETERRRTLHAHPPDPCASAPTSERVVLRKAASAKQTNERRPSHACPTEPDRRGRSDARPEIVTDRGRHNAPPTLGETIVRARNAPLATACPVNTRVPTVLRTTYSQTAMCSMDSCGEGTLNGLTTSCGGLPPASRVQRNLGVGQTQLQARGNKRGAATRPHRRRSARACNVRRAARTAGSSPKGFTSLRAALQPGNPPQLGDHPSQRATAPPTMPLACRTTRHGPDSRP